MNWNYISYRINHEMSFLMGNTLNSVLNECKINNNDLTNKSINIILNYLNKKRNLNEKQINYINHIINISKKNNDDYKNNDNNNNFDIYKDIHPLFKGFNIYLLEDIYNLYRWFIFVNYNYKNYSIKEFIDNIINNKKDILEINNWLIKPLLINIKNTFNFYNKYIINDNIFIIVRYIFGLSLYVNRLLRENNNNNKDCKIIIYIRPKVVESVYNENITFNDNIGNIDNYLQRKKIYYARITLGVYKLESIKDVANIMENYIKNFQNNKTQNVLILIDRINNNNNNNNDGDILYVISGNDIKKCSKFGENYFIGLEFNILVNKDSSNFVIAHLMFGIKEIIRFVPEMMINIIVKLFKKDINQNRYEFFKQIYSNNFKNGLSVKLSDNIFNKYYKILTNHTLISNNYNRDYIDIIYNNNYDGFRDYLKINLLKNEKENENNLKLFNKWLNNNNYDTESIYYDILYINKQLNISSNINIYLKKSLLLLNCNKIEYIINEYKLEEKTLGDEYIDDFKCGIKNPLNIPQCGYINDIINILNDYEIYKYKINNKNIKYFNTKYILKSYDHIIHFHNFNENKNKIREYIKNKIGNFCKLKLLCPALRKHINRKRENIQKKEEKEDNKNNNNDNDDNILLINTLNGLHSYLIHPKQELFRYLNLNKNNKNNQKINRFGINKKNYNNNKKNYKYFIDFIKEELNNKNNNNNNNNNNFFKLVKNEYYDSDSILFDILFEDGEEDRYNKNQNESNLKDFINITLILNLFKKYQSKPKKDLISINFGVSVLLWLKYGEHPIYNNLYNEVLNNPYSTITFNLYYQYLNKSKIKIFNNKSSLKFSLVEMFCIILYTHTSSYTASLRRSFWDNISSNKMKKLFYHWAINLYKAHLYHSKPISSSSSNIETPKSLFHGIFVYLF